MSPRLITLFAVALILVSTISHAAARPDPAFREVDSRHEVCYVRILLRPSIIMEEIIRCIGMYVTGVIIFSQYHSLLCAAIGQFSDINSMA